MPCAPSPVLDAKLVSELATQARPDDLYGDPAYRFWALLRDDEPVAVIDTDGRVHLPDVTHDLPSLYRTLGRTLGRTVHAALGDVLP